MAISTVPAPSTFRLPGWTADRGVSPRTRDAAGLAAAAGLIAIGGAWLSSAMVAIAVVAVTGSPDGFAALLGLGGPFLAVTAPISAFWMLGAIRTRATRRRFAALTEADREAIAELQRLLEAG
jgi:hypothetical protein